ncbi:DUF1707 domain-containing protein [Nocardia sp. NPDC059091]|uniref:DUF1707 SHOCT-like domain-containing protein n=1 Tax=unclassified Nocardia TaxID=2637762 RepID=UPI0036A4310B
MNDSSHTRVSSSERDRALDELAQHFAVGRLSVEELEERSSRVWRAITVRQLAETFADLPAAPASAEGSHLTDGALPRTVVLVGAIVVSAVVCQFVFGNPWCLLLLLAVPVVMTLGLRNR